MAQPEGANCRLHPLLPGRIYRRAAPAVVGEVPRAVVTVEDLRLDAPANDSTPAEELRDEVVADNAEGTSAGRAGT